MTDYTKSTNFASKDSLSPGNALKIVRGTEIDTEFNNIATAVSTKADLASPTFTGTPTAPTASSSTNTTQIATTAFVQSVLQTLYPVGSVYTNASDNTNPGTLLGFGTWSAISAGKMLIGVGTNSGQTFAAGDTGGSYAPSMPSHSHGVTDPGHRHTVGTSSGNNDASGTGPTPQTGTAYNTSTVTTGISINSASSGDTTTGNLPPYLAVYMWQRTA